MWFSLATPKVSIGGISLVQIPLVIVAMTTWLSYPPIPVAHGILRSNPIFITFSERACLVQVQILHLRSGSGVQNSGGKLMNYAQLNGWMVPVLINHQLLLLYMGI